MRLQRSVIFLFVFVFTIALLGMATLRVHADAVADQRAALQAQLAQVQQQIQDNQAKLAAEQRAQTSLENEVAILNSQITEAQLEIKQRDLTIQAIKDGISQDNLGISALDSSVAASQVSLGQIIRDTQHIDDTSFIELALGSSLTDLFQDSDDFSAIKKAMADLFAKIAAQRSDLTSREAVLQNRKQEQSDLLGLQVAQQQSQKNIQKIKQNLITQTKGHESAYKQVIADQQKSVAQIQAALFSLADTNKSVSFGDIYSYAKAAGAPKKGELQKAETSVKRLVALAAASALKP